MAIVIPSKNIYEIENPKVRNNVVNKVSVEQTVVSPDNDYETNVYNESFKRDYTADDEWHGNVVCTESSQASTGDSTGVYFAASYVSILQKYITVDNIKIPLVKDNHFINKLILGKDKNDEPNISFSVKGRINTGTARKTLVKKGFGAGSVNGRGDTERKIVEARNGVVFNSPPSTITNTFTAEVTINGSVVKLTANAEVEMKYITNQSNVGEVTSNDVEIVVEDGKEYYLIDKPITFLCSVDIVKLSTEGSYTTNNANLAEKEYLGTGTYEQYIPEEIEITVYGNTIGISLTDGTATYGSGNRPFKIDGNELLQDSATTNDVLATQYLADHIITEYNNGKETATLLCSIDEYYDDEGNKVISTKTQEKMTFELGDEVLPFVMNEYGKDEPMSYSASYDGLPKSFAVIGKEFIYDGTLWQKLYLEETKITISDYISYYFLKKENGWLVRGKVNVSDKDIIIPETYKYYPVIVIGENAFASNNIRSIVIPKTIQRIEAGAISHCSWLEQIIFNATEMEDLPIPNGLIFANAGYNSREVQLTIGTNVKKIPANLFNSTNGAEINAPLIKNAVFERNSICQTIGARAFYSCLYLEKMILPKYLTNIGENAFYNCSKLSTVFFEGTAQEFNSIKIADGNDSLTSATLYEYSETEPTGWGNYWHYNNLGEAIVWGEAFNSTEGIEFALNPDGKSYSVFQYNGTENEVRIQNYINGKPVTDIRNTVFWSKDITSIKLPSRLKTIGEYAFSECNQLSTVELPEELKTIGANAFASCKNLIKIEIPDSVTSIGKSAFYNCSSLTKVTIGKSVKYINFAAFKLCSSLAQINFNAVDMSDISLYPSDESGVFYKAGSDGDGIKVVIGKDVTKIPSYLFFQPNVKSRCSAKIINIEFEENSVCKTIGKSSFSSLLIEEILIPPSVTSIGQNAFSECDFLSKASFGGDNSELETLEAGAFYYCRRLISISLPKSLKYIKSGALNACLSLETLIIPKNVTFIGEYAFAYCYKVNTIYFNSIEVQDLLSDDNAFFNVGTETDGVSIYVGEQVKKIPKNLFYIIPVNTGDSVIDADSRIKSLLFEPNTSVCDSIGENAFRNCSNLENIALPKSLTQIGSSAFQKCSSLKLDSFTNPIAKNVKTIDEYAFEGCANITQIYTGNSLTEVKSNTFANCTSLLSARFGKAVTQIAMDAFIGCSSISYLYIPKNITYIASYAFPETPKKYVNYEGTQEEWNALITTSYHCLRNADVNFNQIV